MDVPNASGYIARDQKVWADHRSHQRYQGGPNAVEAAPEINLLDPWEQFVLEDGEKKIEKVTDNRTPNTVIFTFNKEDHTLANLLRDRLLQNPRVLFSAYKVPHPLFAKFELRIQTDGLVKPEEALKAACADIITDLEILKTKFRNEYQIAKLSKEGQAGQNGL